jgi:hypothetical protein
LDSLKRHLVSAGAQEDFVSQVRQECQRIVPARRQMGQSLEFGQFGVAATGQERFALLGDPRLVTTSTRATARRADRKGLCVWHR